MPTLSSDQVNYLVWRYLKEEGLALSAYALDQETQASRSLQPPTDKAADGELVPLLLRGIQMLEIESAAGGGDSLDGALPLLSTDSAAGRSVAELKSLNGDGYRPLTEADGNAVKAEARDAGAPPRPAGSVDVDMHGLADEKPSSEFQVAGLERVVCPKMKPLSGGIDAVFNSHLALVVAGVDSTVAYTAESCDSFRVIEFDCQDSPTCVEPLGVDIVGPDHCILVGYGSGCVRQWRFNESGAILESVLSPKRGDAGPVLVARASITGSRVAAVDVKSGVVSVWDLSQRQLLYQLEDPEEQTAPNSASDLVWIGGDSTVAVAHPGEIAIYRLPAPSANAEVTNVAPVTRLKGHTKPVSLLAFEQLTQLLASGGDDGCVCIWNAQSPQPMRKLTVGSLTTPVSHASWLGVHLLTATTDGAVKFWDVRSEPLVILAAVDVGEPVFSLHVSKHTPTHVAVVTPSGAKVYMLNLQQPAFTFVGEARACSVQSLAWGFDQSLAVTTRTETVIARCPV